MRVVPRSVTVHLLRHSQATHNVKAEPMREAGCSFQEFLDQMAADDELDSRLTTKGEADAVALGERLRSSGHPATQADVIISSPLSRALKTADLALPGISKRIVREEWREISGLLLNAKRLSRSTLAKEHPHWCFSGLEDDGDVYFDPNNLEDTSVCAERAYKGLAYILEEFHEKEVVVSCHGGILNYLFSHPLIHSGEGVSERFDNCEMRSVNLEEMEGGGGVHISLSK